LDVLSDGLSMIEKREARHREAMLNYECYWCSLIINIVRKTTINMS
jgi:hypothetical protein